MDSKPTPEDVEGGSKRIDMTMSPGVQKMMAFWLSFSNAKKHPSKDFGIKDAMAILSTFGEVCPGAERHPCLLELSQLLEKHKDISDEDYKKLNDIFAKKDIFAPFSTKHTPDMMLDVIRDVFLEFEVRKTAGRMSSFTFSKDSMLVIMTVPSDDYVDTITEFATASGGEYRNVEYVLERHTGTKLVAKHRYASNRMLSSNEVKDIYDIWKFDLRRVIKM